MTIAYIGLGSNLGDGPRNLSAAWQRLGREAGIELLTLSRFYRSAPVGMVSEHWFTNAVGRIKTNLPPDKLLGAMLAIELESGRDRSQGRDRIIDLDLLLYGDRIIDLPDCLVPHPALAERLFVLAPLRELAPDLVHPQLHHSIRELHQAAQAGKEVLCPL